jgi:hypothetical protein
MRTLSFCAAAMIALLLVEYGAAGNAWRQVVPAPQPGPSEQTVERKGDWLPLPTTVQGESGRPAAGRPEPNSISKPQPIGSKPTLLQGCEPALSPLTGAVPTGLHARCVADAGEPVLLGHKPAA